MRGLFIMLRFTVVPRWNPLSAMMYVIWQGAAVKRGIVKQLRVRITKGIYRDSGVCICIHSNSFYDAKSLVIVPTGTK